MPELETPERTFIDDSGSLADHEATYLPRRGQEPAPPRPAPVVVEPPEPVEEAVAEPPAATPDKAAADAALEDSRDPMGRFRPRHRAKSQQARAEDVPRIKELTRKLKEAQEQLAARVTPPAPAASVAPAPIPAPAQAATVTPTEKFSFQPFDKWLESNPGGDYDAWQDAKLDARDVWRDQQRAAETSQREQQAASTRDQQAWHDRVQAHLTKEQAFMATHPDYLEAKKNLVADSPDPPLLMHAVVTDDNSPALLYHLATHPHEYHEMRLIADGKPVTDSNVASLRRLLQARLQAGTTGAAVTPEPQKRLSRPPTPVRTGPMQTGTEPPSDGASLADHEAFYHKKRR